MEDKNNKANNIKRSGLKKKAAVSARAKTKTVAEFKSELKNTKKPATRISKKTAAKQNDIFEPKRPVVKWYTPFTTALFIMFVTGFAWILMSQYTTFTKTIFLLPEKDVFLRYEFVKAKLNTLNPALREKWLKTPPKVSVLKDGKPITTVAGLEQMQMVYNSTEDAWQGKFPVPWNPERGNYELRLEDNDFDKVRLKTKGFQIAKRELAPLTTNFVVLTAEYNGNYRGVRVKSPITGQRGPKAFADWAKYVGADTLWVLVGKTYGTKGQAFETVNIEGIREIGRACHDMGIKFGVWAMSYLTFPKEPFNRYKWALTYDNGKILTTKGISLADEKRPQDIIDFLAQFKDFPEVDYLGLDYIRNPLGGYELVDWFFKEMDWVPTPEGWDEMPYITRVTKFGERKVRRTDKEFIDAWQWWRAHTVSNIIKRVKTSLNTSKPLWTFTLGWERGWQHGQDVLMFTDAGSDMCAIMMYEATKEQYSVMMKSWNTYASREDTRLLVGDIIDAPLHQDGGAKEYERRMVWAGEKIFKDGPAHGIFIHDLTRFIGGRKGKESTAAWVHATRRSVDRYNKIVQEYYAQQGIEYEVPKSNYIPVSEYMEERDSSVTQQIKTEIPVTQITDQ